jgi:hypothetical protein
MTSEHGPRPTPPPAEDEVHNHFKYTISPGAETLVRLKTLPDAVCRVRFDGKGGRPFTSIASSAGYLDLYTTCTTEGESRRIIVEATNTATAVEQAIDLHCAKKPTHDIPNPAPDPWPSSPLDRTLPALSDEEATEEHASELAARGYPFRPDLESARDAYHTWRRLVSKPLTVVAPSHVANPDYFHHPKIVSGQHQSGTITPDDLQVAYTDNWAGTELWFDDGRTFVLVEGSWVTPSVTLDYQRDGVGDASVWVGLDNSPDGNLLQGGVDHFAVSTLGNLVANYQAWSEMYPNQPDSIPMTNLAIAPGDQILCTAAIVNNSGAPAAPATKAQIHVVNVTKQTIGVAAPPLDSSLYPGARHAVWIVERIQDKNNVYLLLSQFPRITVTGAFAEPADQSQPLMPASMPNSAGVSTVWDFMRNDAEADLAYGVAAPNEPPSELYLTWEALS